MPFNNSLWSQICREDAVGVKVFVGGLKDAFF